MAKAVSPGPIISGSVGTVAAPCDLCAEQCTPRSRATRRDLTRLVLLWTRTLQGSPAVRPGEYRRPFRCQLEPVQSRNTHCSAASVGRRPLARRLQLPSLSECHRVTPTPAPPTPPAAGAVMAAAASCVAV